jgi:hypothetical protein
MSEESTYLSSCEANGSHTGTFCQCTLTWLEGHVTYSRLIQDVTAFAEDQRQQTSAPPVDVNEADNSCS